MHLTSKFIALTSAILSMIIFGVAATPAPVTQKSTDADTVDSGTNAAVKPFHIMTTEEMAHWLANTDAELTYIGEPVNPLTPRSALATTVTYCSHRVNDVCGGPCNVYTGGAECLNAPDTNCLGATTNVGFCDHSGCGGSCNQLSTCGTRLDDGFCFTPGTKSIVTPP